MLLYADLSLDVPYLLEYVSTTCFYLLSNNCLSPCNLLFADTNKNNSGEPGIPLVEEYFSLIASVLILFYNKKFKNWKDVGKYYQVSGL